MKGEGTGPAAPRAGPRWVDRRRFRRPSTGAARAGEGGQVMTLLAILLPLMLALGSIVIEVGNWYTHARHLQTKVDAAAFAGGAMWGFPCGANIDDAIEGEARAYVGDHTAADGTVVTGSFNPQVGGAGADRIFVALNQADWWDDGFAASDFSDPASTVCESKILDVKATEADTRPIWGWLPLYPDIKRKARVEIQEVEGLTGLLPIAVRLPQPLAAAAVFYDESSGLILDVRRFREVCNAIVPDCIYGAPPGLGQWTTEPKAGDPEGSWASFPVSAATGVVVATSVRPACGAGNPPAAPPCMEESGWVGEPVDDFCRQATGFVRCYDADGVGASQTVGSGVHFIRGYAAGDVGSGRPEVRSAWLENVTCPATGYFNSTPTACLAELNVVVDIGSKLENPPPDPPDELVETRSAANVEVRYCLARTADAADDDVCAGQFGIDQDLECSGSSGAVTCSTVVDTHPSIIAASRENAFAIQVRLRKTSVDDFPGCSNDPDSEYSNLCRFFYTGSGYAGDSVPPTGQEILDAPIQRSFMGDIERTTPLRWLRLTVDEDCDLATFDDQVMDGVTGFTAASQPAGETRCYVVDLGTAGGLARDQDEPPIAFNLGDNSSQRAYVDCDPGIPNIKSEIVTGCQWPSYSAHKFDTSPLCPPTAGFFTVPKPDPFDNWPPFRCVITQTGNSNQVVQGFSERIFGQANNPKCPGDNMAEPVWGRNYWHRDNNDRDEETFAWDADTPFDDFDDWGNNLSSEDPRLVTLFFTTYDSFTDTGNAVYPIAGFGNFYVTGYGQTQNGAVLIDDPCDEGSDGDLTNGNGNEPPPDLDLTRNTRWVWGHFVKDVTPAPFTTGGSGVLCNPETSFQPCVAVLVE